MANTTSLDTSAVSTAHVEETYTIAQQFASFAAGLRFDDVPEHVREQAKLLMLDCIGIALASGTYGFAKSSEAAVRRLAGDAKGDVTVIGRPYTLPLRDAALINGILVHGLDFDDTHPGGVIHSSASAFPTAFTVAENRGRSGAEMILAYVLGMEVATRIASAANGGFHANGFHPTGVVGAFGSTIVASKLNNLPASAIALAQGFAGSTAAGAAEFLGTGAWTKRAHPGWASVCGITSAAMGAEGYETPLTIYEGRFGLFNNYIDKEHAVDLSMCTDGLGERWETMAVAVKPFPACHFTHAFADSALELVKQHGISANDVDSVHCLIASGEVPSVCEPADTKVRPANAYDAQFSVPYVVSAALHRNRFTLNELEDEALNDTQILDLAGRVTYEEDPNSGFPTYFSGEIRVKTKDGRELVHREQVNRGAGDRPLSADDIINKFIGNAERALPATRVEQIVDASLQLDTVGNVKDFAALLRG